MRIECTRIANSVVPFFLPTPVEYRNEIGLLKRFILGVKGKVVRKPTEMKLVIIATQSEILSRYYKLHTGLLMRSIISSADNRPAMSMKEKIILWKHKNNEN